nr:hypothetical protein [Pseudomonadota bacterium]
MKPLTLSRQRTSSTLLVATCLSVLLGLMASARALASDSIAIGSSPEGRVEVFFLANEPGTAALFHTWQVLRHNDFPSNLGDWASWESLARENGQPSGVTVAANGNKVLTTAMLTGGVIWAEQQTGPAAPFDGGKRLDTHDLKSIVAATDTDGRIELFAMSTDNAAWTTYQVSPGTFQWANKALQGYALKSIVPSTYRDGRLALV